MVRGAEQVGGDALDQGILDGARGGAWGEAGAVAEAEDVGVHRHGRFAEDDVEDDVRRLAADAWQRLEGVALRGDLAAVLAQEDFGKGDDVAGLALPEADGADVAADAFDAEGDDLGRAGGFGEEGFGGLVHRRVGRLGGEDDGDEQRVRVGIDEFGFGVGAGLRQGFDEAADVGQWHGAGLAGRAFGGGWRHGAMHPERGRLASGGGGTRSGVVGRIGGMSDTVFEAVITPHRSLSRRGLTWIIAFTCSVSVAVTTLFWWLGAWPVAGFNGAEVLLAVVLLRVHALSAKASELLLLSEAELRVVRTDPRGRKSEQRLPSAWINVLLEDRKGRAPGLYLTAHGRRIEVAAALGEPEKRDLAEALRSALHRWRNPVFDNPQLGGG